METNESDDAAPVSARVGFDWRGLVQAVCTQVDWTRYAQAALDSDAMGAMVGAAVRVFGQAIELDPKVPKGKRKKRRTPKARREAPPIEPAQVPPPIQPQEEPPAAPPLPDVVEAATLLGVSIDATEDQLRAALRSRLSSSRIHPDHGGDAEAAKCLIAAKNLLVERARRHAVGA